jgi:hypothetical protein
VPEGGVDGEQADAGAQWPVRGEPDGEVAESGPDEGESRVEARGRDGPEVAKGELLERAGAGAHERVKVGIPHGRA